MCDIRHHSLVRRAKYNPATIDPRLADQLARKPTRVATVAMANKTARIIWAIMARGDIYRTGRRWPHKRRQTA
jgi:transposase